MGRKHVLSHVRTVFCSLLLLVVFMPYTYGETNHAKEISNKIRASINQHVPITKQFPVYNNIRNKIKKMLEVLDESEIKKRQLLKDLAFYNNNNILDLVRYITSREGGVERFKLWKDQEIAILKMEEDAARKKYKIAEDILYIKNNGEYIKDNEIYRISYRLGGKRLIFKESIGLLHVSEIGFERKIPFSEIIQEGAHKFLLYSNSFFTEGGYFYTYEYDNYYGVDSKYGVYKSDFLSAGFDYDDAVFLRLQDAKNNVTLNPRRLKIFPIDYLEDYTELQKDFINTSVIDLLRSDKNYEDTYKNIITTAESITKGMDTEEEKIEAIYHWMIQNIIYPTQYDLEDYTIFSGLEAFENGSAVCEGQVLLMYYLLKIAGVERVEYIDGFVIDAGDFPQARHAWIQIGDYFYDPAFEKITQEKLENYRYYKIPYDIFYTNRYNTRDIPETLFQSEKNEIIKGIDIRRSALTTKYNPDDDYLLLEKVFFKEKYSISADRTIVLNDIMRSMKSYKYFFQNNEPNHILPGFKKNITYYPLDDSSQSIENILIENDYDLSEYVLLEIYNNGKFLKYGLSDSKK